jgi:hypothetical protein
MTLTRPCNNCPFRTDVKPYIRGDRAAEIADAITRRQGTFSCHKTVDHGEGREDDDDGDGNHIPSADEQHCAGALIVLEKINQPNQLMRIYERLHSYDRTKLDMTAPVYDSLTAFVQAHRRRSSHAVPNQARRRRRDSVHRG